MKKQFTNPTPIEPEGKKKHRHRWKNHCDCRYCIAIICKCGIILFNPNFMDKFYD